MACFLVPMALGILTTILRKFFPAKYKIEWLNMMLWGGVLMLAVEHLAHGEVTPYPPFLTAGVEHIIPELFEVGVPMAMSIVVVWSIMVMVSTRLEHVETVKSSLRT